MDTTTSLGVWREIQGEFELVGNLNLPGASGNAQAYKASFTYDESYLQSPGAVPISCSLPLQEESYEYRAIRPFFVGLLPEGQTEEGLLRAARLERDAYLQAISLLNDESVGALVFGSDKPDWDHASYAPLSRSALQEFASSPSRTAFEMGMKSRRSLAGAQPKMGLYFAGDPSASSCDGWFVPQGIAPTTHIVKNSNMAFPGDSVNEALCMEIARRNDLPVAHVFLVPVDGYEPLIATERFDRRFPANGRSVSGLPVPWRCHQEDMCQAAGLSSDMKYEPSGASYGNIAAHLISTHSADAFADTMCLFYALCLDFIIGNCDNHLKNFSLSWDSAWKKTTLAPLYDVANTTLYPQIYREMGISFGGSRVIDDVTPQMIVDAGQLMGISRGMAWGAFCEIVEDFPRTLAEATRTITDWGFPQVRELAQRLLADAEPRRALAAERPRS